MQTEIYRPLFPKNPVLQVQNLQSKKDIKYLLQQQQGKIPSQKGFNVDSQMMVKLTQIMEYLFNDDDMTREEREYEARTYEFAYNYILGATKHYTKAERQMYFTNPKFKYYLNMAYVEHAIANADDQKKLKHFQRNFNRALKELNKYTNPNASRFGFIPKKQTLNIPPPQENNPQQLTSQPSQSQLPLQPNQQQDMNPLKKKEQEYLMKQLQTLLNQQNQKKTKVEVSNNESEIPIKVEIKPSKR